MNDQLQQALANIIASATNAAEASTTFLLEQLPDVLRQLLVWKAAEAAVYMVVGFAALGLIVYLALRLWRATEGDPFDHPEYTIPAIFVGGVGTLVTVPYATKKLLTVVQILIAPKIFLIEYAAHLVTK